MRFVTLRELSACGDGEKERRSIRNHGLAAERVKEQREVEEEDEELRRSLVRRFR